MEGLGPGDATKRWESGDGVAARGEGMMKARQGEGHGAAVAWSWRRWLRQ